MANRARRRILSALRATRLAYLRRQSLQYLLFMNNDIHDSEANSPTGAASICGLDSSGASRIAAMTESAPVAIYHADAAGRLTYANALYRRMFRLTRDQTLDDWAHIVHPLDRQRMLNSWAEFCRDPRDAQFQWRSQSASGCVRFLTETVVPVKAFGVDGFVGTITDVTELQIAQTEVAELQRRLMDARQNEPSAVAIHGSTAHFEKELHDAIREGQFELHYQPKLVTATNAILGAEALIRWRHPTRGLMTPASFIPLAEESGLIGPIGEWVVREACRQARAWQNEGLKPIRVAVNLAPMQFRHGNLLPIIRHALANAELDPRYLEVELTESTVMSDAEASVVILEHLSQMGVLVSIDDFGTGYSSMSYLRRFPVDKLKIDRTFIKEIVTRPDDASIVRAIVSLAHSLRLKVVAEGVETREQLDFLKSLRCDHYQGYLFSPAVPPEKFATLLRLSTATASSFAESEALRTHSKLAAYRR